MALSDQTPSSKKPAVRHRASTACVNCRDRRIRCIVPAGERDCTQCKRSNIECIIRNDDERKRPVSKAYMSSLTDRITLLESMLAETGTDIPPANHPPKTCAEAAANASNSAELNSNPANRAPKTTTPHNSPDESTGGEGRYQNDKIPSSQNESHHETRIQASKKQDLVHRLLSTRGHLSFDQLSGRLRFFGPTANSHIYANNNDAADSCEPPEQVRRTERIIRSIGIETHDYLMNLFWEYYNSVLHIVHKEAFIQDMEASNNKYYSGFLHINILAMGYRFADLDRDDMKMITLSNRFGHRECTLHREAKYMLDIELERPGGIPSIQAFLILGDLECGVGRDNTGWMYAGIANRLCFDMGLHLNCQNDGLSEKEIQIRNMTLFACVIYDKYWALFLGRPTGIKSSDLEMYRLSQQFNSLSACKPAGVQRSLETQIYEELLDLMELAGKITEIRVLGETAAEQSDKANNAYLYVMDLDRQLQAWYRRLPGNLTWRPENIETAPFSFFLLHQQYHCSLILLHRPWARYEDPALASANDDYEEDNPHHDNHSFMSRSICTRQAIRVARIFWHHRQRFHTRLIFVTGIQHAGTAAIALVAALAFFKNVDDRKNNMQYLECLASSLEDMSTTYQPAASMSSILQGVMLELQSTYSKTPPPDSQFARAGENVAIPARRQSSSDDIQEQRKYKKRQLSKSSSPPANLSASVVNATADSAKTPPQSNGGLSTGDPVLPGVGETDFERRDGYVMITPQSERSPWPTLNSDLNALDYPMTFTGMDSHSPWMGSFNDLSGIGDTGALREHSDRNTNHELDFLTL